jgi:ribose transport system permease protein
MSTEVRPEHLDEDETSSTPPAPPSLPPEPSRWTKFKREASFRNVSALYIIAAMVIIFWIWEPHTFMTTLSWKLLLDNNAITAIVAVTVCVPLSAGVVNLALGQQVGIGAVLVAWLLTNHNLSLPLAFVLTLAAGALVGVVITALVVKAHINSFIATLGMSSILIAVINWICAGVPISVVTNGFATISNGELFGLVYPVYFAAGVSLVVWYMLEQTSYGRRVFATGANPEAARLAGIRTGRVILSVTVIGGVLFAFAGILTASQLSTGDPGISPGYLLPAFAAAFLGSTQFKRGRFNVPGTLVAVALLAIGVEGLQLGGAPFWMPDMFNGVVLLIAVGFAQAQRSPTRRTAAIRRVIKSMDVRKKGAAV